MIITRIVMLTFIGLFTLSCSTPRGDLRVADLPQGGGYHPKPLRFEQWTYIRSSSNYHYLVYRWNDKEYIHKRDVTVSRANYPIVGISKNSVAPLSLRPITKEGTIMRFVIRQEPNDLWVTTKGRHQVYPPSIDFIDSIVDSEE